MTTTCTEGTGCYRPAPGTAEAHVEVLVAVVRDMRLQYPHHAGTVARLDEALRAVGREP